MPGWMLPRITDYYDQRFGTPFEAGAIHRLSRRISELEGSARERVLNEISESVARHGEALSDDGLVQMAWILAEDLYKAVTVLTYWDADLGDYLAAACAPFWTQLEGRGYAVHYFVDNAYENTPVGMAGPLEWFPVWYGSARIRYVCPQWAAVHLMDSDGVDPADRYQQMARHIREGRAIARDALEGIRANGHSFVYLDTDASDDFLERATVRFGEAGVIGVVRIEAPTTKSKCAVFNPPGRAGA